MMMQAGPPRKKQKKQELQLSSAVPATSKAIVVDLSKGAELTFKEQEELEAKLVTKITCIDNYVASSL